MAVKYREFKFHSHADKLEIHAMTVAPEGRIIGVVQILHGMCEHKERYYDFMKFLAEKGYLCVIHDHRGHGSSVVSDADLGYFYDAGYDGLVEDAHQVTELIKESVGDVPYVLLGHSMGSLVTRCYLKRYDDEIDKAVIVGSPSMRHGIAPGLRLLKILRACRGRRKHSKLMDHIMMNSSYERRFKKEKLQHAWINSDRDAVEKYNNDRYCNFTFTLDGYENLVYLLQETYSKDGWQMKHKDLPIKFFSGKDDPCALSPSDFGKAIHFMKELGYTDVRGAMYKGMRHEILNEKGRKRVYQDIYDFIKN